MKTRPANKQMPECFTLETRQLLNGAWSGAEHWQGGRGAGGPAEVSHYDAFSQSGNHFDFKGSHGKPSGSFTPPALSSQTQADMSTLRTDMTTLQSEIPASITAAVKADQSTIQTALQSLTWAQRRALAPSPPTSGSTTPPNPTTGLTSLLTAANVPSSEITQITSDFAAYQSALTTTDPTLQAKIAADKAALAKDMPSPSTSHGAAPGGMGFPGGPLGLGGGPGMTF